MNERIKQLAIKSQLVYDDNGKLLTGWMSHVDLSEELTKFAELIVFECVKAVMDGTKEGDHYAQRIEQHFGNGTGGVLHFGVEE
jgi:hypothetical protein